MYRWQWLTHPIFVGRRWSGRLLVSEQHAASGPSPYFLRVCLFGGAVNTALPPELQVVRVRPVKATANSPEPPSTDTEAAPATWLSRWLNSGTDDAQTNASASPSYLSAPVRPSDDLATNSAGSLTLTVRQQSGSRASIIPTPRLSEDIPTSIAGLGGKARIFAISAPLDFRISLSANTDAPAAYKSIPIFGMVPAALPPSYSSDALSIQYLVRVQLIAFDSEPSSDFERETAGHTVLGSQEFRLDAQATTHSTIPPMEIINDCVWHSNEAEFLLPPPPVYPPPPAEPFSATVLAFQRMFGGGTRDPPVPLVLGLLEHISPDARLAELEAADTGFGYLKWVTSLLMDRQHGSQSTDREPKIAKEFAHHKCGPSMVEEFFDAEDLEICRRKLQLFPARWKASMGEPLPDETASAESLSFPPKLATPQFALDRLAAFHNDLHRFGHWNLEWDEERYHDFSCQCEAVSEDPFKEEAPGRFRVSVSRRFVCEMIVRGATTLTEAEASLNYPPTRDYAKSAAQTEWTYLPKILTTPGADITFTFDTSNTSVSLAEIGAKLVSVETFFQPPLSAQESVDWCAHRDKILDRSRRRRNRLSDASASSILPSATKERLPSSRTIVESRRTVVTSQFVPTIQHKVVTLTMTIPENQPGTFRTDAVALQYLIELDFVCILRSGELLDLTGIPQSPSAPSPLAEDSPRTSSGLPFVRMNGPLLPKDTAVATWVACVVLRYDGASSEDISDLVL